MTRNVYQGTAEHLFIEKWADRKRRKAENEAVRAETGRKVAVRKLGSGGVIDAAFISRVKRLYEGEMSVKRIALEMGCGTNTINRLRRAFEWTPRRTQVNPDKVVLQEVTAYLDPRLIKQMDARIFGRYRNRSAYIRTLVKRDMAL